MSVGIILLKSDGALGKSGSAATHEIAAAQISAWRATGTPYLSIYSERAGFVFHLPPAVFFPYFLLFGNRGRCEVRHEATFGFCYESGDL